MESTGGGSGRLQKAKQGNLHQIKIEMERCTLLLHGGDGAVNMYTTERVCGQQDGTVVSCSRAAVVPLRGQKENDSGISKVCSLRGTKTTDNIKVKD